MTSGQQKGCAVQNLESTGLNTHAKLPKRTKLVLRENCSLDMRSAEQHAVNVKCAESTPGDGCGKLVMYSHALCDGVVHTQLVVYQEGRPRSWVEQV